jgi:peptidoglycan/xylan/chitin deacetylase (PgdA/CDA1 family)
MTIPISKRIKTALGRASGIAGIYARDFRAKMVVVAFHRVNDELPEDGLTCGSAKFEAFCRFFGDHFRIVPLSEQVAACHAGKDMGGTLSITFDDGYRDNYEVAAPILRKLGLPATFFVTTGYIGSSFLAPWDRDLTPAPRWMTWDQVRSLKAQGFAIGAHTDTHVDLGAADAAIIRAELRECRAKLERELGSEVALFAYPFGGINNISPASLRLVREAGFNCCLACCGGANPPVADPFQLARIGIAQWFATPHQFGFELVREHVRLPAMPEPSLAPLR